MRGVRMVLTAWEFGDLGDTLRCSLIQTCPRQSAGAFVSIPSAKRLMYTGRLLGFFDASMKCSTAESYSILDFA